LLKLYLIKEKSSVMMQHIKNYKLLYAVSIGQVFIYFDTYILLL